MTLQQTPSTLVQGQCHSDDSNKRLPEDHQPIHTILLMGNVISQMERGTIGSCFPMTLTQIRGKAMQTHQLGVPG